MLGGLFPIDPQWCEWRQDPPLLCDVFVRVGVGSDGRLVLTGLRVEGPPTAGLLRSIPVGRIEAAANAQLVMTDEGIADAGRTAVTGPSRVARSRRQGRPDGFYQDVAREYLRLAQMTTRPALELAESRGVPPTTIYRWIKEARRRRFLPPGRSGKAG